ncbi:MAG: hypothetical protein ABS81_10355 [Pseudonocardia sp. SCN 72-86]|nr:MAG: hypothetical protein ABS81_10355 [Pseudonocardia sp. SCN 72-86]
MAAPTTTLTADDRLDIEAALAGFAAGIDEHDPAILGAVFTVDATLDFGPAARAMGIDFPASPARSAPPMA